ncbi:MAG: GYD domain-containing protein [Solirubrobacterales bacterium]|nr:GYD domain-containing protein [Solirubrobacterales bacterium]
MPKYVVLWNWTDAGVKSVHETTGRVERVKSEFERRGASLDVYWTVGAYDGIGIVDAEDEESATAALLWLGSTGNVRTTTLRAFDAAEMTRILARAAP